MQVNIDSSNGQSTDFVGKIKAWWVQAPLFTIWVFIISVFIYLIAFIKNSINMLGNIPVLTISELECYRLFLFQFINHTFLELIVGSIAMLPIISSHEKKWGTVKISLYFFLKNLELGLIYSITMEFLSVFYTPIGQVASYGMFALYFAMVLPNIIENIDKTHDLLCLPVKLKGYLFLVGVAALFCLIAEQFRFDIFFGVVVGFLHRFTESKYDRLLSNERIVYIENISYFALMKTSTGFVPYNSLSDRLMPTEIQSDDHIDIETNNRHNILSDNIISTIQVPREDNSERGEGTQTESRKVSKVVVPIKFQFVQQPQAVNPPEIQIDKVFQSHETMAKQESQNKSENHEQHETNSTNDDSIQVGQYSEISPSQEHQHKNNEQI